MIIMIVLITIIAVYFYINNSNQPSQIDNNQANNIVNKKSSHLKEQKTENLSINLDSIKTNEMINLEKQITNLFLTYEDAYSNYDYDKLSEICTEKHFKEIHKILEKMKTSNKKRSFENITINSFKLMSINNTSNLQKLSVFLEVSLIDYIIDNEYDFLVKGNKSIKASKNIKMEIIQNIDSSDIRKHCPKCGAPINLIFPTCIYCNTAIYKNAEFKINYFDALVIYLKSKNQKLIFRFFL